MKGFNIEKYMEYQKELFEKFQAGELSAKEYHDLSFYIKEKEHVRNTMKPLVDYIKEHNLPFTIGYAPFNVQYLYKTNDELMKKQLDLASKFKQISEGNN